MQELTSHQRWLMGQYGLYDEPTSTRTHLGRSAPNIPSNKTFCNLVLPGKLQIVAYAEIDRQVCMTCLGAAAAAATQAEDDASEVVNTGDYL